MLFISNKHLCFIAVCDDIDTGKLGGCILHASREAMYQYICQHQEFEHHEVEGAELIIKAGYCIDSRGGRERILPPLENYICNHLQ